MGGFSFSNSYRPMESISLLRPKVIAIFSCSWISCSSRGSVTFRPFTMAQAMAGRMGRTLGCTSTSCFESLKAAFGRPLRRPSLAFSSLAMPSALHKSGRLLSLISMLSLSPSIASSSHLARLRALPSSPAVSFFPRRPLRSCRLRSIVGMLLPHQRRIAQPLRVVAEQMPYVIDSHLEHEQPVEAHAPHQHGFPDAKVLQDLGPRKPRARELHPAQLGMLAAQLHAGLGEGIIVGDEPDFFGARKQIGRAHV